jgi:hypothetical protein
MWTTAMRGVQVAYVVVSIVLRAGVAFADEQLTERGWFFDTDAAARIVQRCCERLARRPWTETGRLPADLRVGDPPSLSRVVAAHPAAGIRRVARPHIRHDDPLFAGHGGPGTRRARVALDVDSGGPGAAPIGCHTKVMRTGGSH